MRVLELYSGIGGLAAALADARPNAQVVAALDINHLARRVYEANFPHPTIGALIEFLPREQFQAWRADLWWMSPPCQPFTRRGKLEPARCCRGWWTPTSTSTSLAAPHGRGS